MIRSNYKKTARGFTIIEVVAVIIVLSILSAFGSSMVVDAMNGYQDTKEKSSLVQYARVVVEQMSRRLRTALPNAIRVSSTGNCIEFMPVVGASNYVGELPDQENGASSVTSVSVIPMLINSSSPEHVVVAPYNAAEVYTSADPAARVDMGSLLTSPYSTIYLSNSHQFLRNSVDKRLFITDDPMRFCLSSGRLYKYYNYGLDTASLNDVAPSGSSAMMINSVSTSTTAFSLSAGSEDRNTAINISLVLTHGSHTLGINHQVLVRNVP